MHSNDSLQELVLFTWAQTACQVPYLLSHFTGGAGKSYVNSTNIRVIWEEGSSIKKMSLDVRAVNKPAEHFLIYWGGEAGSPLYKWGYPWAVVLGSIRKQAEQAMGSRQ